jgi:diguanylate cyclase (GGDEF)-like protein/PAS domain S-box-containing protein
MGGPPEVVLDGLVESTPDAVLIVDDRYEIALANEAAERLFGYARSELLGRSIDLLIPARFRARHGRLVGGFKKSPLERQMGAGMGVLGAHRDGHEFPVAIRLRPVRTDGEGMLVAAIVRDISELPEAHEASWWLTALVQSTGDAIVGLADDGTIASWNPAAERLYGYAAAEVLGQRAALLVTASRRHEHEETVARALMGDVVQVESDALRKDGTTVPVAVTVSAICDPQGAVIGVAVIARDVTDRARFERELRFFADHDPLTGLFNRRRFTEELERHVAYVHRYPQVEGVLLIGDLDNFKQVNDTLGHKAGDELIKALAHQLRGRFRDTDAVGRLGGDEFAVLLPRATPSQAVEVAEELRKGLQQFEMQLEGHRLRTTISIGAAPISAELTPEDTLAAADIAMYEAKRAGRNQVVTAAPPGAGEGIVKRRSGWIARLRSALSEDRFELYTQPIVELASGTVTGHELLIRMREDGELIPPDAFIYMAERFGVIHQIDRYVITRAVTLLAEDPHGTAGYNVNVSGASVVRPDLLQFVASALRAAAVDPGRLTFEITETAAIIDMDAAHRFASGLQHLGCPLALDDFGSGFGSFSYLKYVPVQYLKIDGSFIGAMVDSPDDRLLVEAMIRIAKGKRIKTIAEHVATPQTRELLAECGADFGQGYLLGEPTPAPPVPPAGAASTR